MSILSDIDVAMNQVTEAANSVVGAAKLCATHNDGFLELSVWVPGLGILPLANIENGKVSSEMTRVDGGYDRVFRAVVTFADMSFVELSEHPSF